MAKPKLTSKQEAFAQEVVLNGGDKVAAYKLAGYSMQGNSNTVSKSADELFNNPKVSPRIAELQNLADTKAKELFSISVEQRLEWLKEITIAGMSTYLDTVGNKRRENLTASTGAIKTMNEMLGSGDSEQTAQPLVINFGVNPAVKEVKTTNANT